MKCPHPNGLALVAGVIASMVSATPSRAGQPLISSTSGDVQGVAAVPVTPAAPPVQTYADLVDLALSAKVVARAVIRDASRLKPDQSGDVGPGFARLFVVAEITDLLVGPDLGESLRFLADVPLDAKGKVPKIAKSQVLILGNTVPGRPGELLLVNSDTMFPWNAELDSRLRAILTELVSPDAPPRIIGVREALHVPGNLAGEGETQFFLAAEGGKQVSIDVLRRPGEPTRWGVSFSEVLDPNAGPPLPRTLAWYRLACALPQHLSDKANISASGLDKRIAAEDYQVVLDGLGPCARNRPHP